MPSFPIPTRVQSHRTLSSGLTFPAKAAAASHLEAPRGSRSAPPLTKVAPSPSRTRMRPPRKTGTMPLRLRHGRDSPRYHHAVTAQYSLAHGWIREQNCARRRLTRSYQRSCRGGTRRGIATNTSHPRSEINHHPALLQPARCDGGICTRALSNIMHARPGTSRPGGYTYLRGTGPYPPSLEWVL